jgi:hypothetical protein
VERRDESIDDGIARLLAAVTARREASPRALVEALPEALLARGRSQDDVCLLCLRLRPARPRRPPP